MPVLLKSRFRLGLLDRFCRVCPGVTSYYYHTSIRFACQKFFQNSRKNLKYLLTRHGKRAAPVSRGLLLWKGSSAQNPKRLGIFRKRKSPLAGQKPARGLYCRHVRRLPTHRRGSAAWTFILPGPQRPPGGCWRAPAGSLQHRRRKVSPWARPGPFPRQF